MDMYIKKRQKKVKRSASPCCYVPENYIIYLNDVGSVTVLCQHPDVILHASCALGHWS